MNNRWNKTNVVFKQWHEFDCLYGRCLSTLKKNHCANWTSCNLARNGHIWCVCVIVFVFSSASDWSQKSDRQKSPGTLFLSFSPCLWTFMNMEKPGIGAHFCINQWARNVNVKLISACGKSGKKIWVKAKWDEAFKSKSSPVFLVTVWSELHLWLCLWVLNLYNGSHHANGECAFHCTWIVKNKVVYRNHNYI